MVIGFSQDWPLSREEKKERLLRLYDRDLKETDHLLQMSSREHVSPSGRGASCPTKDAIFYARDSKENIGDNFNTSPKAERVSIPGIIDDDNEGCASPLAPRCVNIPAVPPVPHCIHSSFPTPPRGVDNDKLVERPSARLDPQLKAPLVEEASSSQGSGRSLEFVTPDATPRAPPPLPAISAPAGEPRSFAGKDFSVCKRTGTVIPSIPPMPSTNLRNAGQGDSPPEQALSELFSPDCSQTESARPGRSSSQPGSSRLPRRPSSAAAANAFSVYRSSSRDVPRPRRRSEVAGKELCYPPQVLSAARHGRFAEVEDALVAGFSSNYADSYGNTLFHIACQNGRRRVAKLVVKYGCDMNAQNLKGNTGLHFLFAYGYPEIAEYFIAKGADENIRNALRNPAREGIR